MLFPTLLIFNIHTLLTTIIYYTPNLQYSWSPLRSQSLICTCNLYFSYSLILLFFNTRVLYYTPSLQYSFFSTFPISKYTWSLQLLFTLLISNSCDLYFSYSLPHSSCPILVFFTTLLIFITRYLYFSCFLLRFLYPNYYSCSLLQL